MKLALEPEQKTFRHPDPVLVLTVAQRWRDALLSHSNGLCGAVRSVLSGHDAAGNPLDCAHLAFVPLADVGHERAHGSLIGMGLALPAALSRDDRQRALQTFDRVRQLRLGPLGVWRVEAVTEAQPAWNLRAETWTGYPAGSTHWATVTPVVFDRHPKSKDQRGYWLETAAMVAEGCVRIGLPKPREVIVSAVSAHLGAPPSHVFPRMQRKDGSRRRHTHAILVFEEPVCGPILLGAGRFRGYGLCRPMGERG
jgi:CRISPR-associated protein Csb2